MRRLGFVKIRQNMQKIAHILYSNVFTRSTLVALNPLGNFLQRGNLKILWVILIAL